MIGATDIQNILYKVTQSLGIETYQEGDTPEGKVTEDRAIVRSCSLSSGTYFLKSLANINLYVPDLPTGADLVRLNTLERAAMETYDVTSCHDGTWYTLSVDSTSVEEEEGMDAHYINVKILFEVLNEK